MHMTSTANSPTVTSVHYCIRNKRALFIFNASEGFLTLPAQFEADGIPIRTDCPCLNSSAGKLTVDMDQVMRGGNFTFKLSDPYTQCNHVQYCGRYETGECTLPGEFLRCHTRARCCSHTHINTVSPMHTGACCQTSVAL